MSGSAYPGMPSLDEADGVKAAASADNKLALAVSGGVHQGHGETHTGHPGLPLHPDLVSCCLDFVSPCDPLGRDESEVDVMHLSFTITQVEQKSSLHPGGTSKPCGDKGMANQQMLIYSSCSD